MFELSFVHGLQMILQFAESISAVTYRFCNWQEKASKRILVLNVYIENNALISVTLAPLRAAVTR